MTLLFSTKGNIYIYDTDLASLDDKKFITDNVISYTFEELGCNSDEKKFLFVNAATSVILMHEDDDEILKDIVESCGITKNKYLFFPISDIDPKQHSPGGFHWSLLVFDCEHNRFCYFDSLKNMNLNKAIQLAKQLAPFLLENFYEKKIEFYKKQKEKHNGDEEIKKEISYFLFEFLKDDDVFILMEAPRQRNGYDCGLYLICYSEWLAYYVKNTSKDIYSKSAQKNLETIVTQEAITLKRTLLKQFILNKYSKKCI